MEFYCAEKKCPSKGMGAYAVKLPQEVSVDEHNLATLFCPHCQSQLIRKEQDS